MRCNNVTIKGTGSYLPKGILTNKQIEKRADTTDEWIFKSLGIRERRIVKGEDISDMGAKAAEKALKSAALTKDDIDMLIVATSSPERISPATACTINKKISFNKNVPSLDVNAVCAGFLFSLGIAAPMVSSKLYKNILIIATEAYSKITDYNHRDCVFFGDGAGAMIIGPSKKGWIHTEIQSNGSGTGDTGFNCPLDKKYTTVPKEVWNQAVKVLPSSIKNVLKSTELNASDISMFVPHQASINMLKKIALEVDIPEHKIKTVMHKYGNIAGASIPIAFDEAAKNNEVKKGSKLLFTAIGSGWSWGSAIINYE